jgi:hypothetical protein
MWRERALKGVLVLVGLIFSAGIYPLVGSLLHPADSDTGDTMIVPNENAVWPRTNRFFGKHACVVSDICYSRRVSRRARTHVTAVRPQIKSLTRT